MGGRARGVRPRRREHLRRVGRVPSFHPVRRGARRSCAQLHADGYMMGLISNTQRSLDDLRTALRARRPVRRRDLVVRSRLHEAASEHLRGGAPPRRRPARRGGHGGGQRAARHRGGAAALGMRGILVARSGLSADCPPDVPVISSLRELPAPAVIIRDLTTIEECRQVAALEKDVWGYADAEDVVPPPVLIVSVKRGGILLGAFDGAGAMVGFAYAIPAVKDGRPDPVVAHAGRHAAAREAGIGRASSSRSASARSRWKSTSIEWTYDPLQALNAHLNFSAAGRGRRGVRGEHLRRLEQPAAPRLADRSVRRRVAARGAARPAPHHRRRAWARPRCGSVGAAPLVNPVACGRGAARTRARRPLARRARGCSSRFRSASARLQREDPPLALDWRLETRAIFQHYFSRGYPAVDFFLSREAGRGHYLLAPNEHRAQDCDRRPRLPT